MTAFPFQSKSIPSIQVAVRVRPINGAKTNKGSRHCIEVLDNQIVIIFKPGQPGHHLKSQQGSKHEYAFDYAYDSETTQNQIYCQTVRPLIPTVLNGYNATVFAYGATGSGKTHTMMGSDLSESAGTPDGIIPRALCDIFDLLSARQIEEEKLSNGEDGTRHDWTVLLSYLEVYNEQIRDLLQPLSEVLQLREDPAEGVVNVAGLHFEKVDNVKSVLELLRRGNRNRSTEPTAANKVSSRSHAVLQVTVRHKTTSLFGSGRGSESVQEGKLSLIDLAGSERASATLNRGARLTEGANINKSLLALANCINALSTNKRSKRRQSDVLCARVDSGIEGIVSKFNKTSSKVHYRDSKLTHLLKNSLEGDCRLVIISNINPSHSCYEESHNTLKYAHRAKNIKVRPRMHIATSELSYKQRAQRLEMENIIIRKELTQYKEAEKNGTFETSATPSKRRRCSESVSPSLDRKIEILEDHIATLQEEKQDLHQLLDLLKEENKRLRENSENNEDSTKNMKRTNTAKLKGFNIVENRKSFINTNGSMIPPPRVITRLHKTISRGNKNQIHSKRQRHSMIPIIGSRK